MHLIPLKEVSLTYENSPWQIRHCDISKRRRIFSSRYGVTSQIIRIFRLSLIFYLPFRVRSDLLSQNDVCTKLQRFKLLTETTIMMDKINVFGTCVPNCSYSPLWCSARVELSNSEPMTMTVVNKMFEGTKQQYPTKRGREKWRAMVNK